MRRVKIASPRESDITVVAGNISLRNEHKNDLITYDSAGPPISILPRSFIETVAFIVHVYRISYAVNNSLQSRDASNTSMESIVGCERPARKPEKRIVARSKHPKGRDLSNRNDARSVSAVSHKLNFVLVEAIDRFSSETGPDGPALLLSIRAEYMVSWKAIYEVEDEV